MQTIGFIGLGRMGLPMAARLAAAGHQVRAFDLSEEARGRAKAAGCLPVDAPADALVDAEMLITVLPDERVVEEVAFGADGLAGAWPAGVLWLEMTSSLPSMTRRVAETVSVRGGALVDAPVSGGVRGAIDGSLTIMVAGAAADRERAAPVLRCMGSRIVVIGDAPGAGDVAKSLNNMLSAVNLTAASEAIAIAIREGVDLPAFVEAVQTSTGGSNAMEVKVGRFALAGRFDTGFTIDQYLKDLRIAMTMAAEEGIHPRLAETTRELWRTLSVEGHGQADHTEVLPLRLEREGLTLPSP